MPKSKWNRPSNPAEELELLCGFRSESMFFAWIARWDELTFLVTFVIGGFHDANHMCIIIGVTESHK